MSGSFARDKGQRVERAVVHLLQPIIDEEYERKGLAIAHTLGLEEISDSQGHWSGEVK